MLHEVRGVEHSLHELFGEFLYQKDTTAGAVGGACVESIPLTFPILAFRKLDQFCACDVSPRPSRFPTSISRACSMDSSIITSR